MKLSLKILALMLWSITGQAQADFSSVDTITRKVPKSGYSIPEVLALELCKNLKDDRDKARVIFTWLAENIRYDLDASPANDSKAASQEEYEDKRLKKAYKSGRGVCMDYALLYQRMAQAVGLECVFIPGHSKGSVYGGWEKHAWNAVKMEGQWKLLDATWGAGHVREDKKFHPVFQPGYFFTEPRIFALDHFPDEEKWQCMDTPISEASFKKQSNFAYGDPIKGIQDASPLNSDWSMGKDGKVELRLKIKKPPSVILLNMNGRNIPFERQDQDGWVSLRFVQSRGRELEVWGGEKTKKVTRTNLMGVFQVK
jgi:hypothetical protein